MFDAVFLSSIARMVARWDRQGPAASSEELLKGLDLSNSVASRRFARHFLRKMPHAILRRASNDISDYDPAPLRPEIVAQLQRKPYRSEALIAHIAG